MLEMDTLASMDLSDVFVRSFGSASFEWPQGPYYEHFFHVDDIVPVSVGLGRKIQSKEAGRRER